MDLTTTPPPPDPRRALAHQLYYERRDWRAALALWSACEAADGASLDSRVAITHCRIELADPANLSAIGLGTAPGRDQGHTAAYAHQVRTRAFQWLAAGDALRASQLTRLLAAVEPQLAEVYRDCIASGDLGAPLAEPAELGQPLPFERDAPLGDAEAQRLVGTLRTKRVLLVMRQLLNYAGGAVEADLFRQHITSLRALGIEPAVLDAHYMTTQDRRHLFPEQLRAQIAAQPPDIIYYDDLLVSGMGGDPNLLPAILDILYRARRDHGTRIAVTYPDAWYDGMDALLEAGREVADLFHICHPALLARLAPETRAKVLCFPYPCTDPRPADARPPAELDRACFVGSINWATMPRLVWWTEIGRSGLPVDVHPTLSWAERSAADYAALVARYKVVLNLTRRANQRRVLTQRALEAPLFGSLLLEEFSEDTAYFLRPFEHYVPFANLVQLGTRLPQLLGDSVLRERIAQRGSAFVRRHFSGLPFWARLYARLAAAAGPPPTPPRYVPAPIDVPTTSSALVSALGSLKGAAG
ncbi:MAG: glycosyltransferase family 1 protein [Alphaproteobacteria bacterium]|nr:glycosyltransferase family 1 protein [Alphaproteobacteria bacterium]